MPVAAPSALFDLTTIEQVQAQASIDKADVDSGLVQALITAASRYVINFTGRRGLNSVSAVTDILDGSGSDRQMLSEWPIKSITSVAVNGVPLTPSPDGIAAGYIFDLESVILQPGTAIGGITNSFALATTKFPRGRRNVKVVYQAGYDNTTDPPGNPLYNGAPDDLGQMVTEFVVQQYKRRDWVDQASKTIAAGETIVFRSWEWPPWAESVIQAYKQPWLI